MISGPGETPTLPAGARKVLSLRAWIWACLILVVLTWTPVLAIHLRNMSVADPGTGTLIAVFPPTASTRDLFRSIADAKGEPPGKPRLRAPGSSSPRRRGLPGGSGSME